MSTYNRVTFGHPAKEEEQQPNFYDYNAEPFTNYFKRNESNQEFIRGRLGPNRRGINKQAIIAKLNNLSEQLYEVIFLKESVMSMVGEQRVKMGDFMRELKKYLFQFGVKAQRQSLGKQSKMMNQSNEVEFKNGSSRMISGDTSQLQRICEQLMKENDDLKEKYEQMLLHYRTEIQQLSNALAKPKEQTNYNAQQIRELKQIAFDSQQKLRQEQIRFAERVKYLQSEILGLEDEYLKEKASYERQLDQYRIRERQFAFQESEIQRKNILLIEREKLLTERQIISKQQKSALDRRETKISDYEHNQLRRERQKVQQEKQSLRSQYYVNYEKAPEIRHVNRFNIDTKSQRQKSSGNRLINSRVDITARLRQIEMEKKNNYGGIKNSRMSQAGGLRTERSSSKGRNQVMGFGYQPRREAAPQNVNVKLESMLQSLQKDLNDMK